MFTYHALALSLSIVGVVCAGCLNPVPKSSVNPVINCDIRNREQCCDHVVCANKVCVISGNVRLQQLLQFAKDNDCQTKYDEQHHFTVPDAVRALSITTTLSRSKPNRQKKPIDTDQSEDEVYVVEKVIKCRIKEDGVQMAYVIWKNHNVASWTTILGNVERTTAWAEFQKTSAYTDFQNEVKISMPSQHISF